MGRQDSPLALQGQGRVNPLPNKGARLSGQRLCALEAAGAMPEGSPGLLLPAGRGAAIPQPLRRTCKTDTHHRPRSSLSPAGSVRATYITLGPLTLPHPPALSKGRAALGLLITAVPRLGPHHARPGARSCTHGRHSQGGFKSSGGFANAKIHSVAAVESYVRCSKKRFPNLRGKN